MSFVAVLRKGGKGYSRRVVNVEFVLMIYTESSTAVFYRSTSVLTRVHAHMLARANQNIAHTQVSARDSTHTQMEALS